MLGIIMVALVAGVMGFHIKNQLDQGRKEELEQALLQATLEFIRVALENHAGMVSSDPELSVCAERVIDADESCGELYHLPNYRSPLRELLG